MAKNQAKLEYLINKQLTKLGKVLKKLDSIDELNNIVKRSKGKKPAKNVLDVCFQ
ncbi:25113_t:CDS:1, partial [Racocetra persica]